MAFLYWSTTAFSLCNAMSFHYYVKLPITPIFHVSIWDHFTHQFVVPPSLHPLLGLFFHALLLYNRDLLIQGRDSCDSLSYRCLMTIKLWAHIDSTFTFWSRIRISWKGMCFDCFYHFYPRDPQSSFINQFLSQKLYWLGSNSNIKSLGFT